MHHGTRLLFARHGESVRCILEFAVRPCDPIEVGLKAQVIGFKHREVPLDRRRSETTIEGPTDGEADAYRLPKLNLYIYLAH